MNDVIEPQGSPRDRLVAIWIDSVPGVQRFRALGCGDAARSVSQRTSDAASLPRRDDVKGGSGSLQRLESHQRRNGHDSDHALRRFVVGCDERIAAAAMMNGVGQEQPQRSPIAMFVGAANSKLSHSRANQRRSGDSRDCPSASCDSVDHCTAAKTKATYHVRLSSATPRYANASCQV